MAWQSCWGASDMLIEPMGASKDTVERVRQESAAPRQVFLVEAGDPAAETAEWVVARWLPACGTRPPACVLADASVHAALVEHLLGRFRGFGPAEGAPELLSEAVMTAVDGGATLIHGGSPAGPGRWVPSLLVNVGPENRLLTHVRTPGPILAVARLMRREDQEDFLRPLAGSYERLAYREVDAA